jgi:hypothetical protein
MKHTSNFNEPGALSAAHSDRGRVTGKPSLMPFWETKHSLTWFVDVRALAVTNLMIRHA